MALSLRGNRKLEGPIPESTGNLRHLMIFDVRLTGQTMRACAIPLVHCACIASKSSLHRDLTAMQHPHCLTLTVSPPQCARNAPPQQIVGTHMHGCHQNGSNMPGHVNCLPSFLRFSGRSAPPLETLETRGADVLLPRATLLRWVWVGGWVG